MTQLIPRPRLLPATIIVICLVMAVKSIDFVRAAVAPGGGETVAAPAGASGAGPAVAGAATGGTPGMAPVAAPAPDAAATHGGGIVAAPVSDAERGLLLDLRRRRETLEGRSRALDQREAVISAAEQRVSARIAELAAIQDRLEALEAARKSHDMANWASLVKVYEAMKPRDAATIFDALDMQVLLGVLDRMSERRAAPVLAAMQPDRARLATQLLAEMRTRAVTPVGEPLVRADASAPAGGNLSASAK